MAGGEACDGDSPDTSVEEGAAKDQDEKQKDEEKGQEKAGDGGETGSQAGEAEESENQCTNGENDGPRQHSHWSALPETGLPPTLRNRVGGIENSG